MNHCVDSLFCLLGWCCLAGLLAACGEGRLEQAVSVPESGGLEEPAVAPERTLAREVKTALLDQVRHGPCGPAGKGYARWVEEQLVLAGGALLYSDWGARRKSAVSDEVRFVFTVLDHRYRVAPRAFVWEIRRADGAVGDPCRLDLDRPVAGEAP